MVEQQPVLAPARQQMQAETHLPEKVPAAHQQAALVLGEHAVAHQVLQVRGVEMALQHPSDHMDVPQTAGALLDVGFKVIGRVVELSVALLLLGELGLEKVF